MHQIPKVNNVCHVKYSTDSNSPSKARGDLSKVSVAKRTRRVKFYENADAQKLQILVEKKGKPGIYAWKNEKNGKLYVGSSQDLARRLRSYFNINYLIKESSMVINKALLKEGYASFSLYILEYCSEGKKDLLQREQYYLNTLNPEYNILKIAGSLLGFKHYEKTRAKISSSKAGEKNPMFGKKGELHPMFGKIGEKNPMFGKLKAEGAGSPSQKIEVIDIKNNLTTKYDSIKEAALKIGIHRATISKYFSNNQQKPYKGIYIFKKV